MKLLLFCVSPSSLAIYPPSLIYYPPFYIGCPPTLFLAVTPALVLPTVTLCPSNLPSVLAVYLPSVLAVYLPSALAVYPPSVSAVTSSASAVYHPLSLASTYPLPWLSTTPVLSCYLCNLCLSCLSPLAVYLPSVLGCLPTLYLGLFPPPSLFVACPLSSAVLLPLSLLSTSSFPWLLFLPLSLGILPPSLAIFPYLGVPPLYP
ncbi:hypothetical protein BS47DRAFT_1398647 [Hydnum rufescens UP504]|uniref:Uncharacterized protein n=1 Tax=Hydnum rufescens UP504 TaxID=1448309 RepID=A0A9P6DM07_9AGAM|nr:hypothetical protein BS47DRAFT_1398647 [Hydnum rufescens UP504]